MGADIPSGTDNPTPAPEPGMPAYDAAVTRMAATQEESHTLRVDPAPIAYPTLSPIETLLETPTEAPGMPTVTEPNVADATPPDAQPTVYPSPMTTEGLAPTETPTSDAAEIAFSEQIRHESQVQPGVVVMDVAKSTETPAAEPALEQPAANTEPTVQLPPPADNGGMQGGSTAEFFANRVAEQPVADPALAADSASANNFGAIPPIYDIEHTVELSPAEVGAIKNDSTPAGERTEAEAEQHAATEALAEVGNAAVNTDLVTPTPVDTFSTSEDGPKPEPAPVAVSEPEVPAAPAAPAEIAQPEPAPIATEIPAAAPAEAPTPAPEVAPVDPTLTGAASPDIPAETPAIPGEPPAVTQPAAELDQPQDALSRFRRILGL